MRYMKMREGGNGPTKKTRTQKPCSFPAAWLRGARGGAVPVGRARGGVTGGSSQPSFSIERNEDPPDSSKEMCFFLCRAFVVLRTRWLVWMGPSSAKTGHDTW